MILIDITFARKNLGLGCFALTACHLPLPSCSPFLLLTYLLLHLCLSAWCLGGSGGFAVCGRWVLGGGLEAFWGLVVGAGLSSFGWGLRFVRSDLLAPMPWVGKTVLLLCRSVDQTNEVMSVLTIASCTHQSVRLVWMRGVTCSSECLIISFYPYAIVATSSRWSPIFLSTTHPPWVFKGCFALTACHLPLPSCSPFLLLTYLLLHLCLSAWCLGGSGGFAVCGRWVLGGGLEAFWGLVVGAGLSSFGWGLRFVRSDLLAPMPWVGKTVLLLCRSVDQTNEVMSVLTIASSYEHSNFIKVLSSA